MTQPLNISPLLLCWVNVKLVCQLWRSSKGSKNQGYSKCLGNFEDFTLCYHQII